MNLSDNQKTLLGVLLVALLAFAGSFVGVSLHPSPALPQSISVKNVGASRFDAIVSDGALTFTANPAQIVAQIGGLTVQNANTTPILQVDNSGNVTTGNNLTVSGSTTFTGAVTNNGGSTNNVWSAIVAPTAVGTATPALAVQSLGVNGLQVWKNASGTVVASMSNAGALAPGSVSIAGTPVFWATPQPTATPAIQSQATPARWICNTINVTGSATMTPQAITTPNAVVASLAQDATGDAARVTAAQSAGVITIKVWNTALTPAPNSTPAAVYFCVSGQ